MSDISIDLSMSMSKVEIICKNVPKFKLETEQAQEGGGTMTNNIYLSHRIIDSFPRISK